MPIARTPLLDGPQRWLAPPLRSIAVSCLLAACATGPKEGPSPPPAPPVVALEVQAPDPLDDVLRRHLPLARVNQLAAGEPLHAGELERLIGDTPREARALLETEGYFNALVRVERRGGSPPHVRVEVEPGPQTRVDDVRIDVAGALAEASARGDAHAQQVQQALRQQWPLPRGAPFRDTDWGRAKTTSLARLRAEGYVDAQWRDTRATVDAATNLADLMVAAESGPLHRIGELRIEGLNHHDAATVRNLADLPAHAPATESRLLDFQERLQKSGLFDRATVSLAPDAGDPESTPVRVRLNERTLQDATFGVGYSANVGARFTVEHVHRRPFGQAWLARNELELAEREQRWTGEVATHTLPGLYRNLVAGAYERIESDTDVVTSARVRGGRAQDTRRISRLAFVELERSKTRSALGEQRSRALSAHYHGVWRDVDDLLLPTRGRVWTGQAGFGYARSEPGGSAPFGRLYARLQAYRPLWERWHGQARLEAGQVIVRDGVQVPESMRFRAGGDESVRGYRYRSLTPVENGVEVSGDVLFTASIELARPLLERLPALWGAVFVDAGNAANRWRDLDPALGVGVGLRYRSPVGPLKLDLAWGAEVEQLRLHLTVGVIF